MKIRSILGILEAQILTGQEHLDREVAGACASDLMSDVLAFGQANSILLTGLTSTQVIYTVEMADNRAICFVRDKRPAEETVHLAEEKNFILLCTSLSMFESCGRLFEKGLKGSYISLSGKHNYTNKRSSNHK